MHGPQRKAMVAAYKERKVEAGIYALRCAGTDGAWVGRTADLSKIENRLRFSLAHDPALRASLKAAVAAHGTEAIRFEVLERLGEDDIPYSRDRFLRERQTHWQERLGAEAI